MYYRRVVGLSDGLGDLAAGIERSLIVGVYLPLLEAGMEMTRKGKTTQSAAIVVFSSVWSIRFSAGR